MNLKEIGIRIFVLSIFGLVVFGLICSFLSINKVSNNQGLCKENGGSLYKAYGNKIICKTESVVDGELKIEYFEIRKLEEE